MKVCLLIVLVVLFAPIAAIAQPYPTPPTWGGDFLSRPRLTGNWGGVRDDMAKKGIVFDLDLLLTPQGVVSGGRSTGGHVWGNVDYTLNLDTQKLGLWQGGYFKFQGDTGFGSNALHDSGALVPVNTAALIPGVNERTTVLMNATYTHFFSPKLEVQVGKINTLDVSGTEFFGDYRTQFLNIVSYPMTLEQEPISSFGGSVIAIPSKDVSLSGTVLGASGTPDSNDIGKAFDGVLAIGAATLTIKPFGLLGHQSLSIEWNDERRFSLNQDPGNLLAFLQQQQFPRLANPSPLLSAILTRFFPNLGAPTKPPNQTKSSWAMGYSFEQYVWQPDDNPHHGIGLFFGFGASDGNPNPVQYSFFGGLGGNGVVRGRRDDSWGIGAADTEFSGAFLPFLRQQLNLGLQHEEAVEMYYNAALTPWLNTTFDLQIVSPGVSRALNAAGQLANIDTAVVLGGRVRVRL